MLGKLIKYEFKGTARLYLPFFALLVLLTVVNRLSLQFGLGNSEFLEIPAVISMMLYIVAVVAVFVIAMVATIQRFYKNFMTDEGYLMFTPVSYTHLDVYKRKEDMDKITGLTIGADDYVTKPFNPLELVARVKAQLRRSTRYNAGAAPESHVIDFSGLEINRDTHECRLYDQPVDLTPTEFSLLWMLCQNRGKVLSSEELFEGVWGEKYLDSNNTVMVHIRRLREKLHEPARNPKFIKTCLLYTSEW